MTGRTRVALTVPVALWLTGAACSGGGGTVETPTTPTATTAPPPGEGSGSTSPTTITIGSDGRVSPSAISVAPGTRVTFVNNHTQNHDMSSDPHPTHTDCPAVNQVGFLAPGQSRQTGALDTGRTCGFHDHNQPTDTGLHGTITIQ